MSTHIVVVQWQGREIARQPLEGRLTVGRGSDNSLVLEEPSVSRSHAEIQLINAEVLILDLGSERGTFVAGQKLEPLQPRVWLPGETVQVGSATLTQVSKD